MALSAFKKVFLDKDNQEVKEAEEYFRTSARYFKETHPAQIKNDFAGSMWVALRDIAILGVVLYVLAYFLVRYVFK
jgi:hypothetical protein